MPDATRLSRSRTTALVGLKRGATRINDTFGPTFARQAAFEGRPVSGRLFLRFGLS
jgi:hypothetical protein